MRFYLALVLASLTCCTFADIVTCNDGRSFDGEILSESDHTVRIRTVEGTVTLPRSEVRKIERKESLFELIRKKRSALASDDAQGRWELANLCVEKRLRKEAETLLQDVRRMASPFYVKATLELAEMISPSNPKGAVRLLDDLYAKTGDAMAKLRSRNIKMELDEKRKKAFEDALVSVRASQWDRAIEGLRYAYDLTYPGSEATGADQVSEVMVLEKIIEIRRQLERSARGKTDLDSMAPPKKISCARCPQSAGWGTCHPCAGSGQVSHTIPAQLTQKGLIPASTIQVQCPTCEGKTKALCQGCQGSGLDLKEISPRMSWPLRAIARDAWNMKTNDFMNSMEGMDKMASNGRLVLPDFFKPEYPLSKQLRALLPEVPVTGRFKGVPAYNQFREIWEKASRQVRGNFLVNYAYEVSANALPVVGEAGGDHGGWGEADDLDLKSVRVEAETVAPAELSAFPEEWGGKWVFVEATYKGTDATLTGKDRIAFQVESKVDHNLHPFVFREWAKPHHELGAASPKPPPFLKAIARFYPYEVLETRAKALKEGELIRIFGRVLYRNDRKPETSLEAWDLETFVDAQTQHRMGMVRKPVTFNFQDTPLKDALYFLSLVANTRIKIEVKNADALMVNSSASEVPLAFALSDMIKGFKLNWIFDEGDQGLKIIEEPKPEETAMRESVIKRLERPKG